MTSVRGVVRAATSIAYFLQRPAPPPGPATVFFRCQSTEMLFHHRGAPLTVYTLQDSDQDQEQDKDKDQDQDSSRLSRVVLGAGPEQQLALPVPARTWFTRLLESDDPADFTLFSCALAPGFHIEDFEAAPLSDLLAGRTQ